MLLLQTGLPRASQVTAEAGLSGGRGEGWQRDPDHREGFSGMCWPVSSANYHLGCWGGAGINPVLDTAVRLQWRTPVVLMKVMGNGESAPWGSFQLLGALSHIRSASDGGFHGHGAARQQERKCAVKPGA